MARDVFEAGEWFVGRIYERRCDLSPDGQKLIYFAADYKEPLYSWTAVSRLPYLSPLLLWPKGDGYGGGGLFDTPDVISLNHRASQLELAEVFHLPPGLQVRPFGDNPGLGEDNPIYRARLLRDGWQLAQEGKSHDNTSGAGSQLVFDPPPTYQKPLPRGQNDRSQPFELSMHIKGINEQGGSWYVVEYQIHGPDKRLVLDLGRLDWADWDKNGDLLFAKVGKVFRLPPALQAGEVYDLGRAIQLADFSEHRFAKTEPPAEALVW